MSWPHRSFRPSKPRTTSALDRPNRKRAVGGGDDFDLSLTDQVLRTVIWLRQYPTNEALGFLFGVSDSTASRVRNRCAPVLAKAGRGTMRMPAPGYPAPPGVIDSFEPRAQPAGARLGHEERPRPENSPRTKSPGGLCTCPIRYPGGERTSSGRTGPG
ncbi:helix-turn-helix domain-containing protein [Gemmata sp. SH-PL17]|uniref:helix-turn-helix domain-containing protein n=1 Tax=Gemmata sp. SH-PL17 TaxID=1630693 RepID=UPI0009ED4FB0|nr:transposase family protein [Gemmata sp. SH-PL17]